MRGSPHKTGRHPESVVHLCELQGLRSLLIALPHPYWLEYARAALYSDSTTSNASYRDPYPEHTGEIPRTGFAFWLTSTLSALNRASRAFAKTCPELLHSPQL